MSFSDDPNRGPGDFAPRGEVPAGMARELAQRVVAEVGKRLKTADTRLRCLGLAVELNAGAQTTPAHVIEQAEVLMAYYITGEKPPRPAAPPEPVPFPDEQVAG